MHIVLLNMFLLEHAVVLPILISSMTLMMMVVPLPSVSEHFYVCLGL